MTLSAGGRIGLAGAAVVGVAFGMARYAYGVTLPDIRADLGLSELVLGLIASATFVGYLAGLLLAGPLAARRGSRAPTTVGGVCGAVGAVIVALAPSPWLLALGAVLAGVQIARLDDGGVVRAQEGPVLDGLARDAAELLGARARERARSAPVWTRRSTGCCACCWTWPGRCRSAASRRPRSAMASSAAPACSMTLCVTNLRRRVVGARQSRFSTRAAWKGSTPRAWRASESGSLRRCGRRSRDCQAGQDGADGRDEGRLPRRGICRPARTAGPLRAKRRWPLLLGCRPWHGTRCC